MNVSAGALSNDADVYDRLRHALTSIIPNERLIVDPLRRLAYGTDASMYRLIPKLVVRVESEAEVLALIACCRTFGVPLTFRAAGTSLAGQGLTDSVLMILGDGWNGIKIENNGASIRLQPGVIGGAANRHLAPLSRKIGPDPASIDAAWIGGMAANNSSGMCCGTHENSYKTIESMRVIFGDGAVLDTGDAASRAAFRESHASFLDRLEALGREARANEPLAERIRSKYRIKNTTGYSLNALVDFEDPFDILQHLMIGSEGTLGFMAELTYRTVVDLPRKASALVVFGELDEAARTVSLLSDAPTSAVELLDYLAIRSVDQMPGMPDSIIGVPNGAAALLIETRAADAATLAANIDAINAILAGVKTLAPVLFSEDPHVTKIYWNVRKIILPAVAGARPTGTTVIIEDIAFKVADLAAGIADLQRLFEEHGYAEAVIYGHAKDGNMHFVIYQDFSIPAEVERYHRFMDAVCDLVVHKYDGSLKAEHGTGRNMAPYVALEWGPDAYRLMKEIKALFDPLGLINPGVILNDDPDIHLKNLKPMPAANGIVDRCMECGFCEPWCPSAKLTLTPRQRITSWRAIVKMGQEAGQEAQTAEFKKKFHYDGNETCATCGLCSTVCPMEINTGKLTKELRYNGWRQHGVVLGNWSAKHYGTMLGLSGVGLGAAHLFRGIVGDERFDKLAHFARDVSGNKIPKVSHVLPTPTSFKPQPGATGAAVKRVVYFPSCIIRSMGPAAQDPVKETVSSALQDLMKQAGFAISYPKNMGGLCCGQPWDSQGLREAAETKSKELEEALFEASEGGTLPIVFDASSCAYRMRDIVRDRLKILDVIEFLHDEILPVVPVVRKEGTVMLHLNCGARKMGLEGKLLALAKACAETVIYPEHLTCCGFAGSRGFTHPELNEHATRFVKRQVTDDCHDGYSSNRTCEIGLADQSGIPFRSIAHLVAKAVRP